MPILYKNTTPKLRIDDTGCELTTARQTVNLR